MTNTNKTAIEKLEEVFDSRVIVYVTGERQPSNILATNVALDIQLPFQEILKSFGDDTKKITLVLCTSGGNIDTPWPIVNAIRECCETFDVYILNKALSAGTLMALGADNIYMSKFAHLSPIDPSSNYVDGKGVQKKLEIEDTIGYIDFIKNKVGITEQNALAELTKELTKEIEPTKLGSVNRTHALIRSVAKNLLELHVEPIEKRDQEDIISHLTEKLYAHGHLINRKEARKIGFDELIVDPTKEQDAAMDVFSIELETTLKQKEPFVPSAELLEGETEKDVIVTRGVVYSAEQKYHFNSYYKLTLVQANPPNINMADTKSLWEKV